MNKFIAIGFLLIALFSASCKQKSGPTGPKEILIKYINPDKKEKLSTIVSKIKYIKLETRPDFLLGPVGKTQILDKIYCSNSNKINVFDLNGKALFELNHYQSREPGGYMRLDDFHVDTANHIIEMWDWGKGSINRYDSNNGKFIGSQKFEARMATRFIRDLEWNYYFYANYCPNETYSKEGEIYLLYKFDKDGKFLKKFLREKLNKRVSGGGEILTAHDGIICFNPFVHDFVYTIKNDSLLKIYQFNFGKHSLNEDYFKDYIRWGVLELSKPEFAYSFGGFTEYDFGWEFRYSYNKYNNKLFQCFLSKKTGKLIVSNGFDNDFYGGLIGIQPQDDLFFCFIGPSQMKKIYMEIKSKIPDNQWSQYRIDHSNFCNVCESLTEMDNEVIAIMTPKEF